MYAAFVNKHCSEPVMRYLPVSTRHRSLNFALAFLLTAALPPAFAASPMVVDDADIVGAGQCQAETWLQRWSGYSEFWVMPACNVGGKTELSLGGVRASSRSRHSYAVNFQAKTLLRPLATNSWGVALTAGVIEGLNNDLSGRGWYARSEEHTSELQSRGHLVCRLLLEKKNNRTSDYVAWCYT